MITYSISVPIRILFGDLFLCYAKFKLGDSPPGMLWCNGTVENGDQEALLINVLLRAIITNVYGKFDGFPNEVRDNDECNRRLSETWNLKLSWGSTRVKWVSWIPPDYGYKKLNTDRAVANNHSGYGCILRDSGGEVIQAFAGKCDDGFVLKMELYAAQRGLEVAHGMGYTRLQIESDSLWGVKCITRDCHRSRKLWSLLTEIDKFEFSGVEVGSEVSCAVVVCGCQCFLGFVFCDFGPPVACSVLAVVLWPETAISSLGNKKSSLLSLEDVNHLCLGKDSAVLGAHYEKVALSGKGSLSFLASPPWAAHSCLVRDELHDADGNSASRSALDQPRLLVGQSAGAGVVVMEGPELSCDANRLEFLGEPSGVSVLNRDIALVTSLMPFWEERSATSERVQPATREERLLTLAMAWLPQEDKPWGHEDKNRILEGGPWRIISSLLVLKAWDLSTKLERIEISSLPLWIKVLNLPLHMWVVDSLSEIGSMLGRPICFDKQTVDRGRLNYAKMFVEVDDSKELSNEIRVSINGQDEIRLDLQFDCKPARCNGCRVFRHDDKACHKRRPLELVEGEAEVDRELPSDGQSLDKFDSVLGHDESREDVATTPSHRDDWESVPLRKKHIDSLELLRSTKMTSASPSRFDGLSELGDTEVETSRDIALETDRSKTLLEDSGETRQIASRLGFKGLDSMEENLTTTTWNVRGLNNSLRQNDVKAFLHQYKMSLAGLLETKVRQDSVDKVMSSEKHGGNSVPMRLLQPSTNCLNQANLFDIKWKGPKYSWSNGHIGLAHIDSELSMQQGKLKQLLAWEEAELRQKSRVNWLQLGDSNSSFFYNSLCNCRSRNQIDSILMRPVLITEPQQIGQQAVQFFSQLLEASFEQGFTDWQITLPMNGLDRMATIDCLRNGNYWRLPHVSEPWLIEAWDEIEEVEVVANMDDCIVWTFQLSGVMKVEFNSESRLEELKKLLIAFITSELTISQHTLKNRAVYPSSPRDLSSFISKMAHLISSSEISEMSYWPSTLDSRLRDGRLERSKMGSFSGLDKRVLKKFAASDFITFSSTI
ncbi:hypothetical protein HHK36_019627 [Tetracentron sinense]|uniref:RNase H type-1 domain-containing protein n=1 Tax=Tetracentron sinense TaxID=13715 RepID=A0A834Z2I9_TETSI|nr:hypothetical protein HHK36_019627 [Tetracentron sinense]